MRLRVARQLSGILGVTSPMRKVAIRAVEAGVQPGNALPPEFSWHDYAVYLLHVAAEIEHSLMVQYLYAAYSLGPASDLQPHAREWQNTILGIAKEEMGHLLTVQNALRLIGGTLNLDREDFPWDVPFYPFPFKLQPLTRQSLAEYVFAESPEQWPPDVTQEERREIEASTGGQPAHRVGELYKLMIQVLGDEHALSDDMFREETVPFQASWDEWGRGHAGGVGSVSGRLRPQVLVKEMSSRSEAVEALQAIAQQGEWPDQDPKGGVQELSHFRRFLAIFREFPKGAGPAAAIPTNPQASGNVRGDGPVIQHPEAGLWAHLFNLRYRMLLTCLLHSFRLSDEALETGAASPRGLIISRTFLEMYNLRSLAGILVDLPLDDPSDNNRAGPPFQMPYTLRLPAEEPDCWRLHLDHIAGSETLLTSLLAMGTKNDKFATAVLDADRQSKREFNALLSCEGHGLVGALQRRSLAL